MNENQWDGDWAQQKATSVWQTCVPKKAQAYVDEYARALREARAQGYSMAKAQAAIACDLKTESTDDLRFGEAIRALEDQQNSLRTREIKEDRKNKDTADKIKEIVDLYFAPWGAGKAMQWEYLSGDMPFTAESAMALIQHVLKKEEQNAEKADG